MNFRTSDDLLLFVYAQRGHKVKASAFNRCDRITSGFLSTLIDQNKLELSDFKPIADDVGAASVHTSYSVSSAGANLCEAMLEKRKRDANEEENRKFQRDFQNKQARKDTFRFWFRLLVDLAVAVIGFAAGAVLQYHLLIVERLLKLH